jgi:acyl-CoA synthetase (AMP-forming)/AMP-acid ligase II
MTSSTMQSPPLLLSVLLDRGASLQPDNEIVTRVEGGYSRLTYAQHQRRVYQLASALTAWGVRSGDRVGTFMWNTARHYQCYHALPAMGAVLNTINIRLAPKELGYILTHAGTRVMIIDADLLPLLEAVDAAVLQQVGLFIVCGTDEKPGGWSSTLPHAVDWDEFLATGSTARIAWPRDLVETDAMGLAYTSGTTGNPKGVAFSQRSTYLHTMVVPHVDFFAMSGADTVLSVVPMFHVMSWGLPFASLMLGSKTCLNNRFMDPASIMTMFTDEGVTFSAGVPTIWQGIRTALEADPALADGLVLERLACGGSVRAWAVSQPPTKALAGGAGGVVAPLQVLGST